MISEYFKMAIASIRSAKFRSILTMFGIIVGVSSVVTIVSLGEGAQRQILDQTSNIKDTLIIVRPGKKSNTKTVDLNILNNLKMTGGSLNEKDWRTTEKIPNVKSVIPLGAIDGIASYENRDYNGSIIASSSRLPLLINQQIEFGSFFSDKDNTRRVAVIGRDVAERLFEENVPIGKKLTIRGKSYIVQGVFEQQKSGTFATINVNNSIFLPYDAAREIGQNIDILQLFVETNDSKNVPTVAKNIFETIKKNHAGQEDFAVLEKEEALKATNGVFHQLTIFIASVAFISFIVGGIGIMNIMFATVSERTREIGVRKAIGATNNQILGQFVMEAIVLSVFGGFLGILVSLVANGVIRATSDLQPIITLDVALIVFSISVATGIISGILPAIQAARKDPISALR